MHVPSSYCETRQPSAVLLASMDSSGASPALSPEAPTVNIAPQSASPLPSLALRQSLSPSAGPSPHQTSNPEVESPMEMEIPNASKAPPFDGSSTSDRITMESSDNRSNSRSASQSPTSSPSPPASLRFSSVEAPVNTPNPSQEMCQPIDMSQPLPLATSPSSSPNNEAASHQQQQQNEPNRTSIGIQGIHSPMFETNPQFSERIPTQNSGCCPGSQDIESMAEDLKTEIHSKLPSYESMPQSNKTSNNADGNSSQTSGSKYPSEDERTYLRQDSHEAMNVDDDEKSGGNVTREVGLISAQQRFSPFTVNTCDKPDNSCSNTNSVSTENATENPGPSADNNDIEVQNRVHDSNGPDSHQISIDDQQEQAILPQQLQKQPIHGGNYHSVALESNGNTQPSMEDERNTQMLCSPHNLPIPTNLSDINQLHCVQMDMMAVHQRQHNPQQPQRQQQQAHQQHYNEQLGQFHMHAEQERNHHHSFHYQQLEPRQFHIQQPTTIGQHKHHDVDGHLHHHHQQQRQQFHQHFPMHSYHHHQQYHLSPMQHGMQDEHHQSEEHHQAHRQQQLDRQSHHLTCIDELMMDDDHDMEHANRYKMLSPIVKSENQDDGYETSAGDVLTPNSHTSSSSTSSSSQQPLTPRSMQHPAQPSLASSSNTSLHSHHSNSGLVPKLEAPTPQPSNSSVEDPYNYMEDELNNNVHMMSPVLAASPISMRHQGYTHHSIGPPGSEPNGCGNDGGNITSLGIMSGNTLVSVGNGAGPPGPDDSGQMINSSPSNAMTAMNTTVIPELTPAKKRGRKKKIRDENGTIVNGILKPVTVHKERKKHDRFNGMPEEEVSKRTLPDHLTDNLDIIIIGINPGLFAAYKGHHYAGPGNHFWKCLYLSGLIHEQMTAEEDYKLLDFGIGFTNMVERATKGSADLTRKEIKEGCRILLDKLRKFRPKIAVFNGKLIFEVFSGKKDFHFGRQDDFVDGTNTMPIPREGHVLDYSRWQQNLIGVLQVDIAYDNDVLVDSHAVVTIDARLAYRNKEDSDYDWKLYATSLERRYLDCQSIHVSNTERLYSCETIPLFELGSLHHDFYLLNIRLPVDTDMKMNLDVGHIHDLQLTAIYQNGGFTKVWLSLKTIFFPIVVAIMIWFWHRVHLLQRSPALIEYMLIYLGLALTFLNMPLEYLTLAFDMPFMLLLSDIRQGVFYATLLSFWLVFAGEHMLIQETGKRSAVKNYWKHLSAVVVGCISLFAFDVCERGVQLRNPFYSIWTSRVGTNLALTFIVLAGISAGVYFLFLCYMIWKVFRNISLKQSSLPSMSAARRIHYEGIIYRFKFLMLATLICAALTVIGFIMGQIAEGHWKWDENIEVQLTSAFLTGVYGMWNIYIFALIILYAPSHKQWPTELNSSNERIASEEIEFNNLPSDSNPSEISSLTSFSRKAAFD